MMSPSLSSTLLTTLQTYEISILLVDDQKIVAEAVKRMIANQNDITFHYCSDPSQALNMAIEVKPTVILQDLVMPEVDGLMLVKYFRANSITRDIPIIVLSVKEDPQIKAEAFVLGANDYLVKLPDPLELIARLRYHSNAYIRLLERNEAFKKLAESQSILQGELAEAAAYVKSLLPSPLKGAIDIDWRFVPCTQLGGDAFGYHWIDERYFAIYLLDVCGHGVGAALLSISVINVLRSHALPETNFLNPAAVLKELNKTFPMEEHNGMFFTIWYGVYDKETMEMIYSCGGHPPAILIKDYSKEKLAFVKLEAPGLVIGGIPDSEYQNEKCLIDPSSRLFVFSDGIFEIQKQDRSMMTYDEFIDLLLKIPKDCESELSWILDTIQNLKGNKIFADDLSILRIKF